MVKTQILISTVLLLPIFACVYCICYVHLDRTANRYERVLELGANLIEEKKAILKRTEVALLKVAYNRDLVKHLDMDRRPVSFEDFQALETFDKDLTHSTYHTLLYSYEASILAYRNSVANYNELVVRYNAAVPTVIGRCLGFKPKKLKVCDI